MAQDLERGRTTEIDFINGYVVDTARQFGVNTPVNTAIVETVHAITRGQSAPDPDHLLRILQTSVGRCEASVPFPLSNKGEKQGPTNSKARPQSSLAGHKGSGWVRPKFSHRVGAMCY